MLSHAPLFLKQAGTETGGRRIHIKEAWQKAWYDRLCDLCPLEVTAFQSGSAPGQEGESVPAAVQADLAPPLPADPAGPALHALQLCIARRAGSPRPVLQRLQRLSPGEPAQHLADAHREGWHSLAAAPGSAHLLPGVATASECSGLFWICTD